MNEADLQDALHAFLINKNPGMDKKTLLETPKRFIKMLNEMTSGYDQDPDIVLKKTHECGDYQGIVLVKKINFSSVCEHHLLPFLGHVSIAYIAEKEVVGLSKVARLVDILSKRLQLQERMTSQIADLLYKKIKTKGVAVYASAIHSCMVTRGIRVNSECKTDTLVFKGDFENDNNLQARFLEMIKN